MRVIDDGLTAPYVVEARLKAFEDFVRSKRLQGYTTSGRKYVALHNYAFADSFGPVVYEKGLYHSRWIMSEDKNPHVLLFTDEQECQDYGHTLESILKKYGYLHSHTTAQRVVVYTTISNPIFGSLRPTKHYEDNNYYVLRIQVK